jgi:hypothetical protein
VLRRSRVTPRGFADGLKGAFRHEDPEPALAYCRGSTTRRSPA